ncbi:hypothetical protein [Floridanema evergladense]|uniref:Uncharacterized protein n=1 Tax=Floridaenema evergladense BLCC-F167 TaxID=3153639 RepID=A0ABV4WH22_9CYAN
MADTQTIQVIQVNDAASPAKELFYNQAKELFNNDVKGAGKFLNDAATMGITILNSSQTIKDEETNEETTITTPYGAKVTTWWQNTFQEGKTLTNRDAWGVAYEMVMVAREKEMIAEQFVEVEEMIATIAATGNQDSIARAIVNSPLAIKTAIWR